jgi:hypothetical protein
MSSPISTNSMTNSAGLSTQYHISPLPQALKSSISTKTSKHQQGPFTTAMFFSVALLLSTSYGCCSDPFLLLSPNSIPSALICSYMGFKSTTAPAPPLFPPSSNGTLTARSLNLFSSYQHITCTILTSFLSNPPYRAATKPHGTHLATWGSYRPHRVTRCGLPPPRWLYCVRCCWQQKLEWVLQWWNSGG